MSATRTVPSRRGRPWDEESVRSELTEFLTGRERWPTYEQFIQGGAKGLRDALYRFGGVEYWAREMGLPGGDRAPGGVRHWTDEAIRQTLAEFFGDREDWPSQREFDQAGLHALREALRHYGGPERWAKEMGVVLPPGMARSIARRRLPATPTDKPPRMWPPWDEQRIARELEAFLHEHTEWPRHREFLEAGRKQLYGAVLRNGGTRKWARRMGVKWVKRHGGSNSPWTEDRIREQLAVFLAGRSYWPRRVDFEAEGQRALLSAVSRTGGVKRWAREFGLQRAPVRRAPPAAKRKRASPRPTKRVWDEQRIEKTIRPLVKKLGRWPTKSEFLANGARGLYSAVCRHGGAEMWRKRLDLQ